MLDFGVGHMSMIDGSAGMLQKASAKMTGEITRGQVKDVRQHVMPTIPYQDGTFDAVMFNMVGQAEDIQQNQVGLLLQRC